MVSETLRAHNLPNDFANRIGRLVKSRGDVIEALFDPHSLPDLLAELAVVRGCRVLRVSADRVVAPAAHTRANPGVLDRQRRGLHETRTLRWREMDSNHRFRVNGAM